MKVILLGAKLFGGGDGGHAAVLQGQFDRAPEGIGSARAVPSKITQTRTIRRTLMAPPMKPAK